MMRAAVPQGIAHRALRMASFDHCGRLCIGGASAHLSKGFPYLAAQTADAWAAGAHAWECDGPSAWNVRSASPDAAHQDER